MSKKTDEALATEIEAARQRLNSLLKDAWMNDLMINVGVLRFRGEVPLAQVAIRTFREVEPDLDAAAPRTTTRITAAARNGSH